MMMLLLASPGRGGGDDALVPAPGERSEVRCRRQSIGRFRGTDMERTPSMKRLNSGLRGKVLHSLMEGIEHSSHCTAFWREQNNDPEIS
jgi:hypothetical protein